MPVFMLILAYLLGSFPTAYIAGRMRRGQDIRELGDGNMGAQNAFRQLGPAVGLSVFTIDMLKGLLTIVLASMAGMTQTVVLLCGVSAVAGHNWPFFLRFRGGRGEATAIGVLLAVVTWPMLISFTLGLLVLARVKNVTWASAPGFILLPFLCWAFGYPWVLILYSMGMPGLVGFTHFLRVKDRILRPA